MDQHAFVAGIVDDDVCAGFESLAYFVCLKRLGIFIENAAYEKSWDICFYLL
jgi:hypothetical protein